jgi:peroxiredoxin
MTVLWDPSAAADTEDAAAGALSRAYGTDKLPETYLIDREGKIRYYVVNTRNWSSPDAQRCIRALLKE